ncbi:hypothetical protein VTH06DRAFT_633 [Thermothelomyces fergusii]
MSLYPSSSASRQQQRQQQLPASQPSAFLSSIHPSVNSSQAGPRHHPPGHQRRHPVSTVMIYHHSGNRSLPPLPKQRVAKAITNLVPRLPPASLPHNVRTRLFPSLVCLPASHHPPFIPRW